MIMSQELSELFETGRMTKFSPGQYLFRAGDPVRSMYLVQEGHVDLVRFTKSGLQLTVNQATKEDVLAEASAYSACYHCDGIARQATTLQTIPVSHFLARLSHNPRLAHRWAGTLAKALHQTRTIAEIRALKTVAERLDAWLDDKGELPAVGQIQNLAFTLGVSREALYRELSKRRAKSTA